MEFTLGYEDILPTNKEVKHWTYKKLLFLMKDARPKLQPKQLLKVGLKAVKFPLYWNFQLTRTILPLSPPKLSTWSFQLLSTTVYYTIKIIIPEIRSVKSSNLYRGSDSRRSTASWSGISCFWRIVHQISWVTIEHDHWSSPASERLITRPLVGESLGLRVSSQSSETSIRANKLWWYLLFSSSGKNFFPLSSV